MTDPAKPAAPAAPRAAGRAGRNTELPEHLKAYKGVWVFVEHDRGRAYLCPVHRHVQPLEIDLGTVDEPGEEVDEDIAFEVVADEAIDRLLMQQPVELVFDAQRVRRLIGEDFQNAFRQCDLIMGPVAPTTAWPIGQKNNDPVAMYLEDIFTLGVSLADRQSADGISFPAESGDGFRRSFS